MRFGASMGIIGRLARRAAVSFWGADRVRVVVVGHQKSGTTAVGGLLARALDTDFSNDPLYRIDRGKAHVVRSLLDGSAELEQVVRSNQPIFCSTVVKDPDLSFLIEACVRTFPKAHIVNVVRDPRDTIRSIADRLQLTSHELSCETLDRPDINAHWGLILEGKLPVVDGTTIVDRLAQRWRQAWAAYTRSSTSVKVLRYEDFRSRKAETIYELAEALHLKVKADLKGQVDVRFQPAGVSDVRLTERLGRENVELIEALCSDEINLLGYQARRE